MRKVFSILLFTAMVAAIVTANLEEETLTRRRPRLRSWNRLSIRSLSARLRHPRHGFARAA